MRFTQYTWDSRAVWRITSWVGLLSQDWRSLNFFSFCYWNVKFFCCRLVTANNTMCFLCHQWHLNITKQCIYSFDQNSAIMHKIFKHFTKFTQCQILGIGTWPLVLGTWLNIRLGSALILKLVQNARFVCIEKHIFKSK